LSETDLLRWVVVRGAEAGRRRAKARGGTAKTAAGIGMVAAAEVERGRKTFAAAAVEMVAKRMVMLEGEPSRSGEASAEEEERSRFAEVVAAKGVMIPLASREGETRKACIRSVVVEGRAPSSSVGPSWAARSPSAVQIARRERSP
jgi:hypothetical protein